MSRTFRLFAEPPDAAVEAPNGVRGLFDDSKLSCNRSCTRCELHARARTVCIPADGEPGGVLLIGEGPGQDEDARGLPFVGVSGKYLRGLVAKWASEPIAYDNAARCLPPRAGLLPAHIDACRSYLAGTIAEVQPTRIICLGNVAMQSVLGRMAPILSVRGGYGWVGEVPAFLVPHPAAALRNPFVRQWFEADLKHALTRMAPTGPDWREEAVEIETLRETQDALADMAALPPTAFDCESAGRLYAGDFRLLSLSMTDGVAVYVWSEGALNQSDIARALCDYFAAPATQLVGANIKYDLGCLRSHYGLVVPWKNIVGDVQLERKLIDVEAHCRLEYLAELIGMGGIKTESKAEMTGAKKACRAAGKDASDKLGSHTFAYLPRDVLLRRNGLDARVTYDLAAPIRAQLQASPHRMPVWEQLVQPAIGAIMQVEAWGVGVNSDALRLLDAYLEGRRTEVLARLTAEYGEEFNPKSDIQVAELLFKRLKLSSGRLTTTGRPSVDAEVLEALAGKHRTVDDLVELRSLTTGSGANAAGLLRYVGCDGRIHPSIRLDGTRTGRVSSADPNLLNQPRADTELGKMARDCFVADRGNVLLEADQSQIEYRLAAALSGDPVMREAFRSGEDFHLRTAKLVSRLAWGIEPDAVTKEHRQAAKGTNFGTLYGMGDISLAASLKCKLSEARRIHQAIDGQFRVLKSWLSKQIGEARRTGVVWTEWAGEKARCRPVWQISDADGKARAHAESIAVNSPVQGTASDYVLASLIELVRWILADRFPARLCLTVYDSLLFEVEERYVDELAGRVVDVMTSWPVPNGVPLAVDCKVGPTWGSMSKLSVSK